jgi:hypothetical protein
MRRFTLVVMISIGLLPGLVCKAGDGSVTGDTDYKYPHRSSSMTTQQSANSAPRYAQVRPHRFWPLARDWRISYYWHAHNVPWWPNAPGE